MTGFPGERRNREIALVTDDFALYHKLVPFFAAHGQTILVLKPGEAVPASVRALLNGPAEDARSVPLRDDLEASLLACFTHLDRRPGAAGYRRITLGVDPGKVIGLAVVADGHWLLVGTSLSVAAAVTRLAAWVTGLTAETMTAHVGAGAPAVGRELAATLRTRLPGVPVRIVREHATTPWRRETGSRHTDAAIHIALRQA